MAMTKPRSQRVRALTNGLYLMSVRSWRYKLRTNRFRFCLLGQDPNEVLPFLMRPYGHIPGWLVNGTSALESDTLRLIRTEVPNFYCRPIWSQSRLSSPCPSSLDIWIDVVVNVQWTYRKQKSYRGFPEPSMIGLIIWKSEFDTMMLIKNLQV